MIKHFHATPRHAAGFTLVEVALALVIVALLLGSMLVPLASQIEQRKVSETQKALEEIKEALVGYAIMYGKFPCPTTGADPANANYGIADASCTSPATEGYLPWKTLGVAETDAWGMRRTQTSDTWRGYWRYRVEPNFANTFTLTTASNSTLDLQVRDSANNRLTTTTERPVAIIYSTGRNSVPDGQNASFESTTAATYQSDTPSANFDDLTTWISRPSLLNRMVAAGKLP